MYLCIQWRSSKALDGRFLPSLMGLLATSNIFSVLEFFFFIMTRYKSNRHNSLSLEEFSSSSPAFLKLFPSADHLYSEYVGNHFY